MRIKKKSFREWLGSKRPGQRVGRPRNDSCCPIATYLLEHGYYGVSVMDHVAQFSKGDRDYCVNIEETWASRFVYKLDDYYKVKIVTAKKALEILDSI